MFQNSELRVVRCMPNTPALIGLGASGLFASAAVSPEQKQQVGSVMQVVGTAFWLEHESQIDAVTAVSGSGPAYFFAFIEAMIKAGEKARPRTRHRDAIDTADRVGCCQASPTTVTSRSTYSGKT